MFISRSTKRRYEIFSSFWRPNDGSSIYRIIDLVRLVRFIILVRKCSSYFESPEYTTNSDTIGTQFLTVRMLDLIDKTKVYQ